jgi:hypothetical protein
MNNYICYNRGGFIRLQNRPNKSNSISLFNDTVITIQDFSRYKSEDVYNSELVTVHTTNNSCPDPALELNRQYLHYTLSITTRLSSDSTKVFSVAPPISGLHVMSAVDSNYTFKPRLNYY